MLALQFNALLAMVFACLWSVGALAAEPWRQLTTADGLPGEEIQFLREDDAGAVWVGTLSGLGVWRDGKFTSVVARGEFWDLLPVGNGRYWAGTANGVLWLDGEKQTASLTGNTVAPILRVGEGKIWALSKNRASERNSLMEMTGGEWKPVSQFEKQQVVDLLQTKDGAVWVAVDGNGVFVVGPAGVTHHLGGLNVTAMREDSRGRVWCGLWGKGVAVWEQGSWTRHLPKEKSVILSIREDSKGQIWVATNANGLWRFAEEKWTNDLAAEGSINLLETTSDGRVWISSQSVGGLRYWDGTKWQVSLDRPLPMRCLLETKTKQLWAGGILDGVYRKP
jgi:ligand-binding sensor domain-containing protein